MSFFVKRGLDSSTRSLEGTAATSLLGLVRRYLVIGMAVAVLLILISWGVAIYWDREIRLDALRTELTAVKQSAIKQRLFDVRQYITDQQGRVDSRLRTVIRERTNEGVAVAKGLAGAGTTEKLSVLRQRAKDALRLVRYNDGRGYFFAFTVDGVEELLPVRPELEGKDMLPLQDPDGRYVVRDMIAIAKEKGEGFYEYRWSKPGVPGNDHRKIAYVKLLPELGWVVGTGEYLSDVESDIKHEVLDYIRRQQADDGHAFAGRLEDGSILVSPGAQDEGYEKGSEALPFADLLNKAKSGGGYVEYHLESPLLGQKTHWAAYVDQFAPWGWFIGASFDLAEIDRQIAVREREIDANMMGSLFLFVVAFLASIAFLFSGYGRLKDNASNSFRTLRDHFDRAEQDRQEIDVSSMRYAELKDLAESMNRMLQRRQDAEADLAAKHALLEHLAFHDPLTGLSNRAVVVEQLTRAIDKIRQSGGMLAVCFIDLDGFKVINDTLGHAVGDRFLIAMAERLAGEARSNEVLARLGGDEFVVILRDAESMSQVTELANRLLSACRQPIHVDGMDLLATASIGISLCPGDGEDPESLLSHADAAMYRVKNEGRNSFGFYTPELTIRAFERLNLVAQIQQALEQGQFIVYYQPKVSLRDSSIQGAEALVRWNHPQRGMIPPLEFIDIAEDAGQISGIGWSVLQTVCADLPKLRACFGQHFKVSVNLSKRQLLDNDFESRLCSMLATMNCAPSSLILEVTESAVAHDLDRIEGVLKGLESLGFVMSLDDFGTGFSSLSYLKRLPVRELKIDRSFVRDIEQDADDLSITRAILALGASLEMSVVAEGVETAAQAVLLREMGCEMAQGYLYGRPEPLPALLGRSFAPS